jgi:hypothetical protein
VIEAKENISKEFSPEDNPRRYEKEFPKALCKTANLSPRRHNIPSYLP